MILDKSHKLTYEQFLRIWDCFEYSFKHLAHDYNEARVIRTIGMAVGVATAFSIPFGNCYGLVTQVEIACRNMGGSIDLWRTWQFERHGLLELFEEKLLIPGDKERYMKQLRDGRNNLTKEEVEEIIKLGLEKVCEKASVKVKKGN